MPDNDFDPQRIEEFLQRLRHNRSAWRVGAAVAAGLIALVLLGSTVYTVQPAEVGVVQRFGAYLETTPPGLHFKLPWGIDTVTKVKTAYVYKEEFGYKTDRVGTRTQYRESPDDAGEALMLTGDLNMANVEWAVQYRIQDPVRFLFNVRNPTQTLRDASQAAMRLVVGDRSVDEVLTVGREEINLRTALKLQNILESYETGIKIVTVELQDVNPPDPVKESFDEVNRAKQEKETAINRAREAYNKVIPKARGEAEQAISEAEGYALKRINGAKGDAQRFIDVHRAYAAAPTVTRRRLYIETMQRVLGKTDNVWIVDENLKNVVPLLQTFKSPPPAGEKP